MSAMFPLTWAFFSGVNSSAPPYPKSTIVCSVLSGLPVEVLWMRFSSLPSFFFHLAKGSTCTALSREATANAPVSAAGDPSVPSSSCPRVSFVSPFSEKFRPSFPAATTTITPASRAFLIARNTPSDALRFPFAEPSDILMMSALSLTDFSIAAIKSESLARESGLLEKTFMAKSCALGATPSKL
ncbi:Uncharacterised protein [Arcanobacterium haemolyticum]|nr:Uncharacterised protein [Arcanobacterium haemolyticum]